MHWRKEDGWNFLKNECFPWYSAIAAYSGIFLFEYLSSLDRIKVIIGSNVYVKAVGAMAGIFISAFLIFKYVKAAPKQKTIDNVLNACCAISIILVLLEIPSNTWVSERKGELYS